MSAIGENVIIPTPRAVSWGSGHFERGAQPLMVSMKNVSPTDTRRIHRLLNFLYWTAASEHGVRGDLHIEISTEVQHPEGYEISVTSGGIVARASTADGVAWALQTLRQLLPESAFRCAAQEPIRIPFCSIVDEPSLEWRGGLLDVARHFVPKRFLLRYIDTLALHKFNRLQLHLTDDQGWRIESSTFPRLTSVGSHRDATQVTHYDEEPLFDRTPHGGFYSRADVNEIVAYAADRGITVVPEIELPGHTGAMLAAYPEWGSPVRKRSVATTWGIFDSLVSPLPEVEQHIFDLLDEVIEIFPSPWIHVGGDESLIEEWERDPRIAAFMKDNDISGYRALFSRFMTRLSRHIESRGRRMVTWDDAFASDPETASPSVVMAWRGTEVGRRAADRGYDVVLAPVIPTYFDYYQSQDSREPLAIGGPVTIEDVLAFSPLPADWSEDSRCRVLGTQFQVWTELIRSERYVEYMTWPRACALSEVAWTGSSADPSLFLERLQTHLGRLDALGVEYRPIAGPFPWQEGGAGERRHRRSKDMREKAEFLDRAAATGVIAFSPERGISDVV
jgi:hexosaminidase